MKGSAVCVGRYLATILLQQLINERLRNRFQ